jgi:Uma2 family endonuclease
VLAKARGLLNQWVMIERVSQPRKATAEDLRAAYGEEGRAEIIHGEIVRKANPMGEHSSAAGGILAAVARRFGRSVGGKWPGGWWLLPEIHVQYESSELFCHDVAGWRRDRVVERPTGWPILVRPDWVCEVLSPGHARRDRVEKLQVHHRAGVPHYWIVDHQDKVVEVYRWHSDGYLLVQAVGPGETVRAEPFETVELRVGVLFGDDDDDE